MQLIRLPEAARRLGVSYPTLKQWIYRNKIRSVRTAGGHHWIPVRELDRMPFPRGYGLRLAQPRAPAGQAKESGSGTGLEHVVSGRNQLVGHVVALKTVGLLTKVALDVDGQRVTAIITREASRDLRLRLGETAAALIKATEVMIIRPPARRS